jgi:hypothetical protein
MRPMLSICHAYHMISPLSCDSFPSSVMWFLPFLVMWHYHRSSTWSVLRHFTLSRLCILHASCTARYTPHPYALSIRSQHAVCIIRVYALSHHVSAVSLQWFYPVHLGYKYRVYPIVSNPDLNTIVLFSLPSLWIRSYYTIVVCSILFRAYHPN